VEALFIGTGGNPLAIIEATRDLGGAGDALAGGILPLPVADRIRVAWSAGSPRCARGAGRGPGAAAAGTEAPSAFVGSALATMGLSLDALDASEARAPAPARRDGRVRPSADALGGLRLGDGRGAARGPPRARGVSPAGSAERAWHLSAAAVGADADAADALEHWGRMP